MEKEVIFRIDDPYAFLTKELLTKEYVENKLTDKQIAQKYNIKSKVTIWRRRKFFDIKNSTPTKSNQNACKNRVFNISKEDAIKDLADGLTYVQIAEKLGCSRMVAYRRMKEMGIIENQPQTMQKLKWHETLNEKQVTFLMGCLLGDGNITPRGMFQCNHSNKQLEYIKYKKEILSNLLAPNFELVFNTIKNHQNGKTYYSYYLRTMNNEHLKKIYDAFYVDKVKTFPYEYLMNSTFNAYSLAIWYMDDGGISGTLPSLYTYGFGYNGNLDVLRFLKNKFNLEGNMKSDIRPERSYDKFNFISFSDKTERFKFFQLISPHILPHFQYKLPPEFRT